jgi:aminoglycoside 6'-N-acetyltransferase I
MEIRRASDADRLVDAAEQWARARGCREMASDSLVENRAGQAAHRAVGYEETERHVCFRKRLLTENSPTT